MKKEQILPEWFDGEIYKEGGTVANRFTGEEYELNNLELSMYDLVIGCSLMLEMGRKDPSLIKDFRRGMDWFKENNKEAYRILFDQEVYEKRALS